jgi:tetratricopeptide (TPR) repeat protein
MIFGAEPEGGKSESSPSPSSRVHKGILFLVCALVLIFFAWAAQPGLRQVTNPEAKDSYYNLLVQGFRAGHLSLIKPAPPGLVQLTDPYNPGLNAPYLTDLLDMSYYKGKLYLYFGITPALVLFWPYAATTGHYLSDKHAVTVFFATGFLAAAWLLCAVWRRYFPSVSIWVVALGVLAMGLTLGALNIMSLFCDVYAVAPICGFAFTMLALAWLWCSLHEPKREVFWLMAASLAYGLAVGSRPSVLFGMIILLLPAARAWRTAAGPGAWRRTGYLAAAGLGPILLIGLGLMVYNDLRFDNPFEFGWHYQLTGYEPGTARQFSLDYLGFNLWYYFFEPMRWSGHFPFLQPVTLPPLPVGFCPPLESFGGLLFANFPLMLLVLAVPLAWKNRPPEHSALGWFLAAVSLLFLICGLTLCLFFSANYRYALDFAPGLLLLAVIGLLAWKRAWTDSPVRRRVAQWGCGVLLIGTVGLNVLATLEAVAVSNYLTGNSLANSKRMGEAIAHYLTAVDLEPESAAFQSDIGRTYCLNGQLDESIFHLRKAFELDPNLGEDETAENDQADSLVQQGQAAAAALLWEKSLKNKLNRAETHNMLGDCFLRTGKPEAANQQFQAALKINPDSVWAYDGLGFAFFTTGRSDDASTEFQMALAIDPTIVKTNSHLGLSFLFQKGNIEASFAHYQWAIQLQPPLFQACNDLGDAFRRKGMAAEAVACYQKAIELQPQFTLAQANLAWILATWPEAPVRDGGQAVALAEKAKQSAKGNDPLVLRSLAAAYAETGRFPEAIAMATKALALAKDEGQTGLAGQLDQQIAVYQTNSPWRSKDD